MLITKVKNFPIDMKTLKPGLIALNPKIKNVSQNILNVFIEADSLDPQEILDINEYWDGLTEANEAIKLAKNSRKQGLERKAFRQAVKAYLYNKDWSTLTVPEKKFIINDPSDPMTDIEIDALVIV